MFASRPEGHYSDGAHWGPVLYTHIKHICPAFFSYKRKIASGFSQKIIYFNWFQRLQIAILYPDNLVKYIIPPKKDALLLSCVWADKEQS